MTELLGISVSPFSEKARFSLDHHGVPYRYREYVPMLGEPGLRIRLRKPTGTVSVPVLFDRGRVVTDSFRISRYAEAKGAGAPLFPEDRLADIVAWNDRCEAALTAGRALTMRKLLDAPETREEAMPPFIPKLLRPALGALVDAGYRFVRAKYDATDGEAAAHTFRSQLVTLRAALAGRDYLLGDLTFADVAMSALLFGVAPPAPAYVRMGTATRAAFADAELAREFADLVAWRDGLYAKHRKKLARA
jgi:glutathione S-transferase